MRLNNFKIKNLPINKKISDGSGLNLTLTSRYHGNWTFRYTYNGKAKEMGLGSYPEISIVEARNLALEKRTLKSNSIDPIFEKKTLKKTRTRKDKMQIVYLFFLRQFQGRINSPDHNPKLLFLA